MTQMRKCIVMSPDDEIRVKNFIRNVEAMRNEWMKLVQPVTVSDPAVDFDEIVDEGGLEQ